MMTPTEPDHLTQRQCFGQVFGEQINYKNLFSVQYDFLYLLGISIQPLMHINILDVPFFSSLFLVHVHNQLHFHCTATALIFC